MERRKNCTSHIKDTEQNTKDISGLCGAVYGNGKRGLLSRMDIMETNFSAVGKSIMITSTLLAILMIVLKFL